MTLSLRCATRAGLLATACLLASHAFTTNAFAAPVIVLGDSIGVGISMAAKAPRLAHNSVAIRSDDIVQQIRHAPSDKIALLSLGTNDAVASISGLESRIDRILDAAHRANVRLVWMGPPCVLKPWNTNATKLDAILRERLSHKITYVSIADRDVCARDLRAKDGVHFNMKGYALLWERARSALNEPIEGGPIVVSDEPEKPVVKRRHRRHREADANLGSKPSETRTSSLERDLQGR